MLELADDDEQIIHRDNSSTYNLLSFIDCIDKDGNRIRHGEMYRPVDECMDCQCVGGKPLCPTVDCIQPENFMFCTIDETSRDECCPRYNCPQGIFVCFRLFYFVLFRFALCLFVCVLLFWEFILCDIGNEKRSTGIRPTTDRALHHHDY